MHKKDQQPEIAQDKEEKALRPSKLIWRSFIRDKAAVVGLVMTLVVLSVALFCPLLAPYDPLKVNTKKFLHPPSKQHWLGNDKLGRDVFSRLMYGARTSMIVSFGSIFIAVVGGVIIGVISGYYGGRLDNVIMRILDVFFAIPAIILALAVVAVFGPNLINLLLTLGFVYSLRVARVARGSVLSVKEKEFIEGVRSVGARDMSIMSFFILPNIIAPIIVQATYFLATAIMAEAGLSFLGMGTQPPTPAWGIMLSEARTYLEMAPWLSIVPGLAIVFAVLAFNLMGDGLRNALDPRVSQR